MTDRKTPAAGGSGEEVPLADEANRLYWESEISVNRLADDLGLSKGALYSLIEPLAAEFKCPECGLEMAYLNRTARLKDFLGCPSCGFEAAASKLQATSDAKDEVPPAEPPPAPPAEPPEPPAPPAASADSVAADLDEESREPVGSRATPGRGAAPPLIDLSRVKEPEEGVTPRGVMAGATLLGIAAGVLIVGLFRRR